MKDKRPKYPINPKRFDDRANRMTKLQLMGCPRIIFVNECYLAIWSYYGSRWKTWSKITQFFIFGWWHQHYRGFLMWICDKIGWTKIYKIPETKDYIEHWERHGNKCSGSPNCNNMNCIQDSIPKWFKILTRI